MNFDRVRSAVYDQFDNIEIIARGFDAEESELFISEASRSVNCIREYLVSIENAINTWESQF